MDARDDLLPAKLQRHFNKYGLESRLHASNNFIIDRQNVDNFIRYKLPKFYNELNIDERNTYSKQMYIDHFKSERFFINELEEDLEESRFNLDIDELPFL